MYLVVLQKFCRAFCQFWRYLTNRDSNSGTAKQLLKGATFWILSLIWLLGCAAAMYIPFRYLSTYSRNGDGKFTDMCDLWGICRTKSVLLFLTAGIIPSALYCCACYFSVLKIGEESPPYGCVLLIGKCLVPRVTYQLVVDQQALSVALQTHAARISELEEKIADEQESGELITFELQTGDSEVVQVKAYPDCSVAALESVLQPDAGCGITLANGALARGATLHSQGITNDTHLEVERLCGSPTSVLVPSSLQIVLEHHLDSPPNPLDHMKRACRIECCSWSNPDSADEGRSDLDVAHACL